MTDFDRTQPCARWEGGECDCFDPDDHYKGGAIYYTRPVCKAEESELAPQEESEDSDMSGFKLQWRPLPTSQPPVEEGYALKWILVKRFGQHDGSLKESLGIFTNDHLPYLEGIRDAAGEPEVREEARRLIECIEANPQGVRVWIGD